MTAFLCVPAAVQTFTQPRGEDQRSAEALLPSKFTGLMKSLLGNLPGHSGSKIEGSESAVQPKIHVLRCRDDSGKEMPRQLSSNMVIVELNSPRTKLIHRLLGMDNAGGHVLRKKMQSRTLAIGCRQRKALNSFHEAGIAPPAIQTTCHVSFDCIDIGQRFHHIARQLAEKKLLLSQQQLVFLFLNSLAQLKRSICGSIRRSAKHKDCHRTDGGDGHSSPVCKVSDVRSQRTDFDCHDPSLMDRILPRLGCEEGAVYG